MQDEYVKLEKGTVQVTRTGYGPTPLVLLSGFSTLFPGLEYGALGTELAKKFPVLIPSKFGYGYSDLTDAPRDVDAIVEEYRAVLSALKVPTPVVLCAHSMGFLEALRWAQKYPEEVAALVGLDPATPEVYQTFDLTGSQARLEKIQPAGVEAEAHLPADGLLHVEPLSCQSPAEAGPRRPAELRLPHLGQREPGPSGKRADYIPGRSPRQHPRPVPAVQREGHAPPRRGVAEARPELSGAL